MSPVLSRRRCLLLAGAAAFVDAARLAADEPPMELGWPDLIPTEGVIGLEELQNLDMVGQGQTINAFDPLARTKVTREYDGKRVRIPGYVVPLNLSGTGVTDFLLVPYVGACIHVPPPPPNQLVLVTTETPYEAGGLFDAVWVTGAFRAITTRTELAEVGYSLTADQIEPYS